MLTKIQVHAHASPTEFEVASALRSSISGTLFIGLGDVCFPAQHWGDYVLPTLNWWIENAQRLNFAEQDVKNIFMDGPYTFHLRRSRGRDDLSITLGEGVRRTTGVYTISYRRYLATLRGAAKSVLNELKEFGFRIQGEAAGLQSRLEHLERLEAEIKEHGLK